MCWTGPADDTPPRHISGAFYSEDKLNNGLIEKYLYNNGFMSKAEYYRRVLP
jgi:hypothetical protein